MSNFDVFLQTYINPKGKINRQQFVLAFALFFVPSISQYSLDRLMSLNAPIVEFIFDLLEHPISSNETFAKSTHPLLVQNLILHSCFFEAKSIFFSFR